MAARHRRTTRFVVLYLTSALVGCSANTSDLSRPSPPVLKTEATPTKDVTADVLTMGTLPPLTDVAPPRRIPRGADPRVPYVDGATIVFPDGRQTVLERPPQQFPEDIAGEIYGNVVRVRAGWIGSTYDFMDTVATFHAPDGSFRKYLGPAEEGPIAVSADGRRALLSDSTRGTVVTTDRTGVTIRVLDSLPDAPRTTQVPVGFIGLRGRQVVVNLGAETRLRARGVVVTGDGRTYEVPGVARAAAGSARARIISGTPHPGSRAKASTIYSLDGEPWLRAPGFELIGFSPGGTYAVGVPHRWNPRRFVVISLETGDVLLHMGLPGHVSWEDDRHLLALVTRSTPKSLSHGLLRLSLDGAVEWALPLRPMPRVAGRPLFGPHPIGQPG